MLKDILSNKKNLIILIVVAIIVLVLILFTWPDKDSKGNIKSDKNEEQLEDDKNIAEENYDAPGLELKEETDESIDSVDGSGDWDNPSDKKEETAFDDKSGNQQQESINQPTEDKEPEGSEGTKEEENENEDGESDEDTLVDDKTWGRPS